MQQRFIDSITQLPTELAQALKPILNDDFSGYISKTDIDQLKASTRMEESKLLLALLPIAASLAKPPISEFYVGAIVKATSGDIYMGANMELASEALYNSIHAEQHAISHAWLSGEQGITDIVVNFSPCGHCRQFINEIVDADKINIHLPSQEIASLSHYLPYAFGPTDLNISHPLFQNQPQNLLLNSDDPVLLEALKHANLSYAPYSQCYSAVIIEMNSGKTYAGRYAENAAFNPSMLPLQMAWANLQRHNDIEENIRRVVLLESATAKISLKNATKTALRGLINTELEYIAVNFASI